MAIKRPVRSINLRDSGIPNRNASAVILGTYGVGDGPIFYVPDHPPVGETWFVTTISLLIKQLVNDVVAPGAPLTMEIRIGEFIDRVDFEGVSNAGITNYQAVSRQYQSPVPFFDMSTIVFALANPNFTGPNRQSVSFNYTISVEDER